MIKPLPIKMPQVNEKDGEQFAMSLSRREWLSVAIAVCSAGNAIKKNKQMREYYMSLGRSIHDKLK